MVATLTSGVTTRQLSSCFVGLKVIGEGDLARDGAGAEVVGMTEDLIGAVLTGGTFIDDTTVGGGVAVGTVLTTTEAATLAGSAKQSGRTNQIWYMNWNGLMLSTWYLLIFKMHIGQYIESNLIYINYI